MKSILKLTLAIAITVFGISCSDDEPKVDPIVGEWELKEITFLEPPSGYQRASSEESDESIWNEDSYTINFFADGTYERELNNAQSANGATDLEDNGEWDLDGDDLDLDEDETDTQDLAFSFTVVDEISDREMNLEGDELWFAWPPSIVNDPLALDTLENDEIADFFFEYGEIVEFKANFEFRKIN